MARIVMSYCGMTIKAKRNGVVDIGFLGIQMSYFNSQASDLAAQTTVTRTPQEDTDFVFLSKIILASCH